MKQLNGLFFMMALVALSTVHAQSINVTSTGVGVGTATPSTKLDVRVSNGMVQISDTKGGVNFLVHSHYV
jgi:hypothetical protein